MTDVIALFNVSDEWKALEKQLKTGDNIALLIGCILGLLVFIWFICGKLCKCIACH